MTIHNKSLFTTLILFVFLTFSINLFCKDGYKIRGKVIDESINQPLPGANISIPGTKLGDISDKKGKFKISGINSEKVTIYVSFIGYHTDSIVCDFSIDKKPEFTIRLKPDSKLTEEIRVEAKAEGQMKAFIEQNKAENIKNIVSSEQIAQFPDMNAAEAMQRIPGITLQRDQGDGRYVQLRGTPPELTNFNINGEQIPSPEGDVRFVGMDIISADQIEFIEITKVLTPDMDADGIGGTVNVITKKASSSVPEISSILSSGYGNLRQTGNHQLQFSFGQRYNNFGINLNTSYYVNNQGSDNMEFKYAKGPLWGSTGEGKDNYHVQYRESQLRHYDITRERTGLSATLDYEFNENHNLYLRGMYNNFSDDEIRRRKIYDLEDALSESYYINSGVEHELRDRLKQQEISSINFGGKNDFDLFLIDYEVSFSLAKENNPNTMIARFGSTGQYFATKFSLTEDYLPIISFPDPKTATNAIAYDKFKLDELRFENSLIEDKNYTGKINFTIPYSFDNWNNGYVKFGAKIRSKIKIRDINTQVFGAFFPTSTVYPGTAPDLNLAYISDGFSDDNLLGNGYLIDYMPSADNMRKFYEFYPQHFIFDRTETKMQSFGKDYTAKENIFAGYLMTKHEIGNLMILAGVRYEKTEIDYQGVKILTYRGNYKEMDTLYDKRNHEFLLPQIQFKYTPIENLNIRLAATRTYARPNFEDVLPYREQDRKEVKYGNPELKFPTSTNIDFLGEYYMNGGTIFSGGLFYKKIENFIFYYKRFAHEGTDFSDYGLVEIEKAVNGLSADIFGAELQAQFKLGFLPGFLSDFGFFMNYTFTSSEAYVFKRIPANYSEAVVIFDQDDMSVYQDSIGREKIQLPGQAEHTVNFAFFYDGNGIYAKISTNFHDAFLYSLGADKDLDVYYDKSLHLDFTANYQITNNMKIFCDIMNITNAPLRYYLGRENRFTQQEYYSWWGRLGLKLSF